MNCPLCQTRRPRRFCAASGSDICSQCCGEAREVTLNCPLDCEYLREARLHDRPAPLDPSTIPNLDIPVTDDFLATHDALVGFLSYNLCGAAFQLPNANDLDVREALASLTQTYRTLQSGVYYDSKPTNPLAASMHETLQGAIAAFRRREHEELGITRTRDADVLGVLAFLQRLEMDRNNGRPRSRAFLHMLWEMYGGGAATPGPAAQASSLILP